MISKEEAVLAVQKYLDHPLVCAEPVIITKILDKPYGWIFFWNSKRFVDGDIQEELVGNYPILFTRHDAKFYKLTFNWRSDVLHFESNILPSLKGLE